MSNPCNNCGADIRICKDCDLYNSKYIELSIIKDIKAEIKELRDSWEKDCYHDEAEALGTALRIIDKHISGEEGNND